MNTTTLHALQAFPERLQAFYEAIPASYENWAPPSWDGVPSEKFTPIEQICHVRDVEIDGYHERFRRALDETNPFLANLDGYRLARERGYVQADATDVFAAFHAARAKTLDLLSTFGVSEYLRPTVFEDLGAVNVRGLVHLLCSHDQQHLAGLQWLLARIETERTHG